MPSIHIPTVARDPDDLSDFLARLPDCAQAKIEAIRRDDLDREGKINAKLSEMDSLREQRDNLAREIGHFDRQKGNDTEEQQARRARMAERLAGLKAQLTKVSEREIEGGIGMNTLLQWAASLPPYAQFEACEVEPCEADDPMAELTRIRRQRTELIEERDRVEHAPLPIEMATSKAHAVLDSLVKRGRPNVSALFHLAESITGRRRQGDLHWPTIYGADSNTVDTLALLAWLMEDTLRKKLDGLLKDKDRPLDSITVEERAEQVRIIDARLEALEYTEEIAFQACIAARYDAKRRQNVKVEAMLGIRRAPDMERPAPKEPEYPIVDRYAARIMN